MTCPACTKAQANPLSPFVKAGCVGCGIRELARSPEYHASGLDGFLAQGYKLRLGQLFGDDWRAGHEKVKAERERQRKAVTHA